MSILTRGWMNKVMLPVAGKPFLSHLLFYLSSQGITKVVIGTGYKSAGIKRYFRHKWHYMKIVYSLNENYAKTEYTYTILKALKHITDENCLLVYGDTLFDVDIRKLEALHLSKKADVTIALKHVPDVSRFGTILLDKKGQVSDIAEKNKRGPGLINGGVCILNTPVNLASIKDVYDKKFNNLHFVDEYLITRKCYGKVFANDHIDIGTPNDYAKWRDRNEVFTKQTF
ncbi:MAG: sugar phosphate nucleotidyltransferase [Planctomycetota bacterium]|nr:sugar phosphate nucleotidyltransferase [Planctomycetota bacterium]